MAHKWVRIKNLGQICEVMGETGTGALMLKNPQAGRNEVFHPAAVEPAFFAQYHYCWQCDSPMVINVDPALLSPHYVCSVSCYKEMLEHYS